MNKAELEAQVVKLERRLARARAQTAELKKALKGNSRPQRTRLNSNESGGTNPAEDRQHSGEARTPLKGRDC